MGNGRKLGTWMWIRIACWLVKGRTFPLFLVAGLALAGFAAASFSRTSTAHAPAGSPVAATAPAGGQSFAGHWTFQFLTYCYEADWAFCDQMNTDVPGAYTQVMTITADSNAQGRFAPFQYDRTISDNTSVVSPQCNAGFFSGHLMTGVCHMTGRGTGYFAPANGTILPVLWITNEWVTFQTQSGAQLVHNPRTCIDRHWRERPLSKRGLERPISAGVAYPGRAWFLRQGRTGNDLWRVAPR